MPAVRIATGADAGIDVATETAATRTGASMGAGAATGTTAGGGVETNTAASETAAGTASGVDTATMRTMGSEASAATVNAPGAVASVAASGTRYSSAQAARMSARRSAETAAAFVRMRETLAMAGTLDGASGTITAFRLFALLGCGSDLQQRRQNDVFVLGANWACAERDTSIEGAPKRADEGFLAASNEAQLQVASMPAEQ
mmetsp:Transcript_18938/g.52171  ORF Transcript_18938/g.52171 Transcript_18938/m.52171 type:complete len:202 (+) Transcript_18938:1336-1941(+)